MDLIECTKVKLADLLNSPILPETVKEDLQKSGEIFLTIYSKNSKTLRFFPIKDGNIWWLKIAIKSFSPETSGKILAQLNNLISEFVYSTGICVSKSECFWNGIILDSALKTSKDKVVKTIQELPNVSEVSFKAVK